MNKLEFEKEFEKAKFGLIEEIKYSKSFRKIIHYIKFNLKSKNKRVRLSELQYQLAIYSFLLLKELDKYEEIEKSEEDEKIYDTVASTLIVTLEIIFNGNFIDEIKKSDFTSENLNIISD
jgi:hypothetical protein